MKSANKAHFSDYIQSAHTKHGHFVNYDVIADKVHFVLMGKRWQVVDYYFLF